MMRCDLMDALLSSVLLTPYQCHRRLPAITLHAPPSHLSLATSLSIPLPISLTMHYIPSPITLPTWSRFLFRRLVSPVSDNAIKELLTAPMSSSKVKLSAAVAPAAPSTSHLVAVLHLMFYLLPGGVQWI